MHYNILNNLISVRFDEHSLYGHPLQFQLAHQAHVY